MRKYAIVKPLTTDGIKKVMIYSCNDGVYVFLYNTTEDVSCVADYWFESLENAEAHCAETYETKQEDWILVDEPLETCQHDIIAPVRIKGRDTGRPEWGKYEKLIDGNWVDTF